MRFSDCIAAMNPAGAIVDTDDFPLRQSGTARRATVAQLKTALVKYTATIPATADAAGSPGQYAADASFLYVCVAANTWVRVAVATW